MVIVLINFNHDKIFTERSEEGKESGVGGRETWEGRTGEVV